MSGPLFREKGWEFSRAWLDLRELSLIKKVLLSFIFLVILVACSLSNAESANLTNQNTSGCYKVSAARAMTSYISARRDNLGRPTNGGVAVNGYVIDSNQSAAQGIDVSSYQATPDFSKVPQCNGTLGTFVYVRMMAGEGIYHETHFRNNWKLAVSSGLLVGPYDALSFQGADFHEWQLSHKLQDLITLNRTSGVNQANLFMQRLAETLEGQPNFEISGSSANPTQFLPIALAVNQKPDENFSSADQLRIGQAYGAEVCKWIWTVQHSKTFGKDSIILATSPSIYVAYGFGNSKLVGCDLSTMKVWLLLFTNDGSSPFDMMANRNRKEDGDDNSLVDQLCRVGDSNRCIFHNYTSEAKFANFSSDPSASLDLDRFYSNETVLKTFLQTANLQ